MRKLKLSDVRIDSWNNTQVVAASLWAFERRPLGYAGPLKRGVGSAVHAAITRWIKDDEQLRAKREEKTKIAADPNADPVEREDAGKWLALWSRTFNQELPPVKHRERHLPGERFLAAE